MPIIAQSPTRVDLVGGTLDISPLTQILKKKVTVNFGVDLHAKVNVRLSDSEYLIRSIDQKIEVKGNWDQVRASDQLGLFSILLNFFWKKEYPRIEIIAEAKSPAGAGLGGSSCLGIAMASALVKARKDIGQPLELSESQFIQTVQDLETSLIRVPTGCQDYWGGLRGGVNIIRYEAGGARVETLRDVVTLPLEEQLILCYSGKSRASATNNWAIFKKAFDGDSLTLSILNEIGQLSVALAECLVRGQWDEVFRLSSEEWKLRTKLWPDIETKETKAISNAARDSGAFFSRICGAGGGGVMAIFAPKDLHMRLYSKLQEVGGTILDAHFSKAGTSVVGEL